MQLSGGSIWLDETRIDTLPPEKRGFGMVFQNYALFPHMTVEKNIGFGLQHARRRRQRSRAARREGAEARAARPARSTSCPGQLSGGQQQRVAIARAIVIEPPLVLMDEPLSNLDAKLRIETRAEIRRIHRELGRATIYVTHDQDEALSLADRIVVMKDGVVQQIAHAARGLRAAGEPARRALHGLPQRARARRRAARTATASRSPARTSALTGAAQAAARPAGAPWSRCGRKRSSLGEAPDGANTHRRPRRQRRILRARFAARRA